MQRGNFIVSGRRSITAGALCATAVVATLFGLVGAWRPTTQAAEKTARCATTAVQATLDDARYRITSVLGSGVCEGLPATETSIVPVKIAVSQSGHFLFSQGFGQLQMVRQIQADGTIGSLAWVRDWPPIGVDGHFLDVVSRFGNPSDIPTLPRLDSIADVAVDLHDHVVAADSSSRRLFLLTNNSAVPIAGTGDLNADSGGDGGPALNATFHDPESIAFDSNGNIYVIDVRADGSCLIRFINTGCESRTFYVGTSQAITVAPGNIATIAGGGTDTSDGAMAINAALYSLGRIAFDPEGNLFFAAIDFDSSTSSLVSRVRAVNLGTAPLTTNGVTIAPATIETIAGGGQLTEDGVPAKDASIDITFSESVALDRNGNLFFAEYENNDIKRVDSQGTIRTYVGDGNATYTAPGANRASTTTVGPSDVVIGPDGTTLYYAGEGEYEIRAVGTDGIVRRIAGNGLYRYCGDGHPATAANPLYEPMSHIDDPSGGPQAIMDKAGNIYFCDFGNNVVRKIAADGTLSTVLGQAIPCAESAGSHSGCAGSFAGDGGPYTSALLNQPYGLALDDHGIYISDVGNRAVRYANLSNETVQRHGVTIPPGYIDRVAGIGPFSATTPGALCPADPYNLTGLPPGVTLQARMVCANPLAIALLPNGDLVFTEFFNRSAVWRVDAAGNLSLVAGRSAANGYGVVNNTDYTGCNDDGGPATQYDLCEPTSLSVDTLGNIYVGLQAIGNIIPGGHASERVAYINLGANAVTVHGVTVNPGYLQRIAGKAGAGDGSSSCVVSAGDGGLALEASVCSLRGVAQVGDWLFLSDAWNDRLRVVDGSGVISTFAGAGTPLGLGAFGTTPDPFAGGYDGDGGTPSPSRLMVPGQLSVPPTQQDFLLIQDNNNLRLRAIVDCEGAGAGTALCAGSSTGPAPTPTPAPAPVSFSNCPSSVQLTRAVSRETHGGTQTFDVDLPLTGNVGVECRRGGANGDYQIVMSFSGLMTFTRATTSAGSVNNISGSGTNEAVINLTGIPNGQRISVTLTANDGISTRDFSVPIGILVGDTNGDGVVNSADIGQTKSQSGQPLTSSNFREDLNTDGGVNSADIGLVKSKSGTALP